MDIYSCSEKHLTSAINICINAHKNQLDKANKPYIYHPMRVASGGNNIDEIVLGFLHDVVEDHSDEYSLEILSKIFPKKIISSLDAISRRSNESTDDYLIVLGQEVPFL